MALITGGSGGIGIAIAKVLLEGGCKVIVSGTSKEKLVQIKVKVNSPNFETLIIDYSRTDLLTSKISDVANIFGSI